MQIKINFKPLVTLLMPAFFIMVVFVGAAIFGFIDYGFVNLSDIGINLLQDDGWLYFPGAQITNEGVHFEPLGRVIVHQDGSVAQPNPPLNLSGQHLKVKGDFRIRATLIKIDKQASLRLYASPPIVYDQWRYEAPSIDINFDVEKNIITARIFDGNANTSADIRIYKAFFDSKIAIFLEHKKDQIDIVENGYVLLTIPDHDIFDSGEVWFGADGAVGSTGWTLALLSAQVIGKGSVEVILVPALVVDQSDPNSLRNLAEANMRKIKIGAAVALEPLLTDEQYRKLALGQFSMMTPENSMKPEFIHPMQNIYDFAKADLFVDIALKNNMAVHGHALVYDKSTPDWMVKTPKEQRQEVMVSHIENVVKHFKGQVAEWDVVNEPLSDKNALYKNGGTGLKQDIWFEAMGEEYIDLAFNTAHKADPSAKLYLNEYGIENDGQRWDALLSLVKRLKGRGVPIDGVGFEAHVYGDGDYINSFQLQNHMKILAGLGLLTRISEIDVTGDDPAEQINQYVSALDICLYESNCTSYTTWGITDLYGSTTRSDRYPLVYGTSLLWDKDIKAKPAYASLQKKLK